LDDTGTIESGYDTFGDKVKIYPTYDVSRVCVGGSVRIRRNEVYIHSLQTQNITRIQIWVSVVSCSLFRNSDL
jgi:hypothetical protein